MDIKEFINTYLWFGYIPPKEVPIWLDECITTENKGELYTPEEVASRFDKLFDKLLSKHPAEKHIIPLSGGWDSRLILGGLLERLEAQQIETVTFGVPGQLDFDIGIEIAKRAGVKHHVFDLKTVDFTWDNILDSVKKSPWTYTPDGYFNQKSFELVNDHHVKFWSGFLGDAVNGGHTSKNKQDLSQVLKDFVYKERMSRNSQLVQSDYEAHIRRPTKTLKIEPEDAVFFGYHCTACSTPINLPTIEWSSWNGYVENKTSGLSIFTPFVDELWAGYWLSASREHRINQNLFFEFLEYKFPESFALPSKSRLGFQKNQKIRYQLRRAEYGIRRRLNKILPAYNFGPHSTHNYLDYNKTYRDREDYQETLKEAFSYLKEIDATPWLDFDKLWEEHNNLKCNHAKIFNILLGLAANLKVNGSLNNILS